jgi:hypothetical protein
MRNRKNQALVSRDKIPSKKRGRRFLSGKNIIMMRGEHVLIDISNRVIR